VLTFETETDVLDLDHLAARQPDSAHFRDWEVAGTAHADTYITPVDPTDTGDGQGDIQAFDTVLDPPSTPDPTHPPTGRRDRAYRRCQPLHRRRLIPRQRHTAPQATSSRPVSSHPTIGRDVRCPGLPSHVTDVRAVEPVPRHSAQKR